MMFDIGRDPDGETDIDDHGSSIAGCQIAARHRSDFRYGKKRDKCCWQQPSNCGREQNGKWEREWIN